MIKVLNGKSIDFTDAERRLVRQIICGLGGVFESNKTVPTLYTNAEKLLRSWCNHNMNEAETNCLLTILQITADMHKSLIALSDEPDRYELTMLKRIKKVEKIIIKIK